jgi:hypothetical protein
MRRHRLALTLVLAVAAVIFLTPLIRGEVFTVRDHLDYFQPLRWFTAEELKAGRIPLWNPYSASGEPWLANPQTGIFYPPAWLFVVLPFPTAYMLFLFVHLALLGWGAYLLFARDASPGAALVGAVAVMLSGPTLSLLDINNNLATLAWLPFVLWCARERAWRRGAAALALSFLAGEPYFAGIGAVMFLVVWSAAAVPPFSKRRRAAALQSGIAAFGLTAVQLFPFLDAIRDSDRATGMKPELILRDSMPLADWLRVAVPPTFTRGAFDPSLGQHFIPIVYVGMLVAALAVVGLTSIRRKHVLGWLALLIFSVIVAAGPELLTRLPLTLFRYPARMVPLGALAIAGLAVAGWERIRGNRPRWLDLLVVLIVIVDLVPRARPLLETAPFDLDVVPYAREIGGDFKFLRVGTPSPSQRAQWISGYLNLYQRRFDADTAAPFTSDRYLRFYRDAVESPTAEEMAFLSAGYLVSSMKLPRVEPLARAGEVTVYRNPGAYPMARFASTIMRRGGWQLTTNAARVIIDAPENGTAVLAQQLAPGWRVTVDGKAREPLLVDGVFRGVEVAGGRHEIIWSYRPWPLLAGALVTFVTLLAMGISILVKRREEAAMKKNFSSCPSNLE